MTERVNFEMRPYLSVVLWPQGWTRGQVAELLAKHTDLDTASLRLGLGEAPPTIVGRVGPDQAEVGLAALRAAGGDGFAPTLADLEALGPTLKIKDLRLEGGALEVDLWRGSPRTIQREDVQILIRAHLSESVKTVALSRISSRASNFTNRRNMGLNTVRRTLTFKSSRSKYSRSQMKISRSRRT